MQDNFLESIKNAGVVGAGGAGFPAHVKLSAAAEYVLVNGAECEPLINVDQQLMDTFADKLLRGLKIALKIANAQTGIIALKSKYKKARSTLEKLTADQKNIKLYLLDDFYPAGDEQVIVCEVLKRIVPEGGIPLKVGCIVSNVESLINIADAVNGIPVTDTYLTIGGDVPNPLTVKIPIGTPIAEVVSLAGIMDLQGMEVIDGGPLMGKIVTDFSQPVTKTTKALLIFSKDHPLICGRKRPLENIIRQARSVCIQCRQCTDSCPRYLLGHNIEPHKIMRSINYWQKEEIEIFKMALLCSECGACEEYACPMSLSPRRVNAKLKKELAKRGIKLSSDVSPQINHLRENRKIPTARLKLKLGIKEYDVFAPLTDLNFQPQMVRIPLLQHIGKPALPIVEVGQKVMKGDLIAAVPENSLGVNIHASISGTIQECNNQEVIISASFKKGDE